MKKINLLIFCIFMLSFAVEAGFKWSKFRDKTIDSILEDDESKKTEQSANSATFPATNSDELLKKKQPSSNIDFHCAYLENLNSENWKRLQTNNMNIYLFQISENWDETKVEYYIRGQNSHNKSPHGLIYNFKDESNYDYIKISQGNKDNFIFGRISDGIDRIQAMNNIENTLGSDNRTYIFTFEKENICLYKNGKKLIDLNLKNFKLNDIIGLWGWDIKNNIKLYLPKSNLSYPLYLDKNNSPKKNPSLKITYMEKTSGDKWKEFNVSNMYFKMFKVKDNFNISKIEYKTVGNGSTNRTPNGIIFKFMDELNFSYIMLSSGTEDNFHIGRIVDGVKEILYLSDIDNQIGGDNRNYIYLFNDNTIKLFKNGKKIFQETFKKFEIGDNIGILGSWLSDEVKIYLPESSEGF